VIVPDRDRWKRLSPLLDSLLDLEGPDRDARLDEIARQDAEIAAELRGWLADEREAGANHFLSGHAELPADPQPTPYRLAGERIGAYILESPLGQGGSGVVWQARRADGRFEGKVALKLLHLSLIGRSAALRFEREGAILARLAHPNIARMLDAGITSFGQPYLVLELVDGERIDRHCDASHLRIDQRIALFRDVLGAVTHAHRHLVVHRDIKPSNILVTADGTVKLLDFGIAKLLQGDADGDATEITREGGRALTPDYAAPEQLRGEEVTTATDVYSLGVLLYQLLTGRHPTAQARSTPDALMRSTLDTDPSRLSTAVTASDGVPAETLARISIERDTSLIRLKRQLGGDLENIVAKALRKVPAERYATVDAFSDDLRRWGSGEPVRARADTVAYRTARFVSRHRGKVAAGALTFVAIIAGVIGTISQARRAEQQARQAQVERDNALRDLAYADAARDLLGFLVSQGNAKPQTASELLGRAEQLTEQQFADDLPTRGRLELLLGIEYGNVDEFEKSKQVLARAQASARAAGDPALLSNVDCLLAATLGDQNEAQRAMAMFGDAIDRLHAASERNGSVLAACLQMRADLHAHLGQPEAMLADAQGALIALGAPRPDQRVLANSIRVVVAEAYGRLGQTAQALAAYEKSIADLASMGRQQSARTAVRYNNFSRMLYVAGQPRRAEEMAARGLEISRGSGPGSELDAILEGNRARALVELGRYDEARSLTEHALAAATERKDLRWAGTFALYGAPAWCASGDAARCASLLDIARDRFKATLPPAHANFAVIELETAQLSQAQGQPAEAGQHLARAVELFGAASDKNPLRIRALGVLARSDLASGDMAAATRHANAAVDEARVAAKGLASSAWLGGALVAKAIVQQRQGDKAAAQASLHEAIDQLAGSVGKDAPATREARTLLAAS
jgi:serine/threonine protein kinase/tetratricopeptide (TPR) repeat protein